MTPLSSSPVIAGVPVKPFGVAKQRLDPVLDAAGRARLGKAMALRTMRAAAGAGLHTVIVTGSDAVRAWAGAIGMEYVDEVAPSLNGAAKGLAAYATARGAAWLFIHADLPLVGPEDLDRLSTALRSDRTVLAPARDGGTNAFGGRGQRFSFGYGPGSFHRHVRREPTALVISRPGLALDVDTPRDLLLAAGHRRGAWLEDYLIR